MIKDHISIFFPVKNVFKSKEFYTKLGFKVYGGDDDDTCSLNFKNLIIMFCSEPFLKDLLTYDISNTKQGKEVLFDIELKTKEELYELANLVKNAGGILDKEPTGIEHEAFLKKQVRIRIAESLKIEFESFTGKSYYIQMDADN